MGTEVLRPHDCLLCPSLAIRNSKPIRRRRDSSLKRSAKPRHPAPGGGHLVVRQVAILRRGESLEAEKATKGEPVAGSGGWGPAVFVTGRLGLGPDRGMIPREVPLLVPAAEAAAGFRTKCTRDRGSSSRRRRGRCRCRPSRGRKRDPWRPLWWIAPPPGI
ncbi:unnamed protein product [Musa acuminata subsp. burmannicoides]